jgi:hypothetical protein
MLHYRRYGFALQQNETLALALADILKIIDGAEIKPAPLHFLFDAGPANATSARMLEKFPDLATFASRTPAQPGYAGASLISNLDGRWQGGNPEASDREASRELLLAVVAGIPEEFPLWIASILIGPLRWTENDAPPREATAGPTSLNKAAFSGLSPSMTYLAPGIILQYLSRFGLRLWITEQLPDPAPARAAAPVVQQLLDRFSQPQTDSILSVPESQEVGSASSASGEAAKIHAGYKARMGEIVAGLSLPFKPPDPRDFAQVPREPLGKIRAVIADTFKADGWKRATERIPAGSHKLWKETPGGRRLELAFDTGSWSRHVVCTLGLLSERGAARIPIPADPSLRMQYMTPNPEVFIGVLENMRMVVAELERTWAVEMEAAIGPLVK